MSSKPRRNALGTTVEEAQELIAQRATGERRTSTKKRNRDADARRSKATYDLPPELIERVREIAVEIGQAHGAETAKVNDVARLLLEAGIAQYEQGQLGVTPKTKKVSLFND